MLRRKGSGGTPIPMRKGNGGTFVSKEADARTKEAKGEGEARAAEWKKMREKERNWGTWEKLEPGMASRRPKSPNNRQVISL